METKKIVLTNSEFSALSQQSQCCVNREMADPPVILHGAWYWQHLDWDNGDGVNYFHSLHMTTFLLEEMAKLCPYGKVGDELSIEIESWEKSPHFMPDSICDYVVKIQYIEVVTFPHPEDALQDIWTWSLTLMRIK